MDSPDDWRWVWLAVMVVFTLAELFSPVLFFFLPVALGALVAMVLAFAGVSTTIEWMAFLGVSLVSLAAMRPLARRLDRDTPHRPVGANRLLGDLGLVLETIPSGVAELGKVRVQREEWRASTPDGRGVEAGTTVRILRIEGTKVVVWPADLALPEGVSLPEPQPG